MVIKVFIKNETAAAIGKGTDTPLPRPFDWLEIPASTEKSVSCRDLDLRMRANPADPLPPIDVLNQLVARKVVSLNFSTIDGKSLDQDQLLATDGTLPEDRTSNVAGNHLVVETVATSNTTKSGTGTVGGASLDVDEIALLVGQTDPVENGPWVCKTGAWVRPDWFNNDSDLVPNMIFRVVAGTDADSMWQLTTDAPTMAGAKTFARVVTAFATASPAAVGTAAVGTVNKAAREDHVHAHGNQASDGNMHAAAIAAGAAGFMTGADKTKLDAYPAPFNATVSTTDGTVTTITSVAIPTDKVVGIDVTVVAIRDTEAEAAVYKRVAAYRNAAGTVTIIGTVTAVSTQEDAAAWDVTFVVNGTNVDIKVTGEAGKNIAWRAQGNVVQTP